MIAIIDYGVGNLFSLTASLKAIGEDAVVTRDPALIHSADRLILPGVGAFADAAAKLRESGMDRLVISEAGRGKPLLGICLGMQLLFQRSFEYGVHAGLGLVDGDILPFADALDSGCKIPHIGWNTIDTVPGCPLFRYIPNGSYVYFVHSYYAPAPMPETAATTEYGVNFTSAVWSGNVFGCQFHPEKSGETGLMILRGFVSTGA